MLNLQHYCEPDSIIALYFTDSTDGIDNMSTPWQDSGPVGPEHRSMNRSADRNARRGDRRDVRRRGERRYLAHKWRLNV